jgi:hypothetical protein
MPKEYINYPEPEVWARPISLDEYESGEDGVQSRPAAPQVGIHWDGVHGNVQLSFDMDADVLSKIVSTRNSEHPDCAFVEDGGRAVFYTASLNRGDLQRLIKHARRARDAAFGADE